MEIENNKANKKAKNKEKIKNIKIDKKAIKNIEKAGKKTMDDYKKFALKGNVIDLAIGVVIGGAFTNIVNSLVTGVITPVLGLLTNRVDLSSLYVSLTGGVYSTLEAAKESGALVLNYGLFLNAILNFFIISFVLFILISYIRKIGKKQEETEDVIKEETTKTCKYCFTQIDINATRCPNCTSILNDENEDKDKDKDNNKKR